MNLEQQLEVARKESAAWKELIAQRDELLIALDKLERAARAMHAGQYIEKYDEILDEARDIINASTD